MPENEDKQGKLSDYIFDKLLDTMLNAESLDEEQLGKMADLMAKEILEEM